MKRIMLVVALMAGLLATAAPAVASAATAAPARTCGASAVLVSHGNHDTTVRKTDRCYCVRAFGASSAIGYRFGPWTCAIGTTSHVHTVRIITGGGYETSAGRIVRLWGSYIRTGSGTVTVITAVYQARGRYGLAA